MTANTSKKDLLLPLLRAMRAHVSWEFGRVYCANLNLDARLGWEKALLAAARLDDIKDSAIDDLAEKLCRHLLHGDKSVRLLRLGEPLELSVKGVAAFGKGGNTTEMAKTLLDAPATDVPKPVLQYSSKRGTAVIYKSKRLIETRTKLDPSHFGSSAALDEFSEIIGVKRERKEVYDVLFAHAEKPYVEMRVEANAYTTADPIAQGHLALRDASRSVLKGADAQPVNVFRVIDKIYKTKSEGTIVELAFSTTTASVKHERMRRQRLCLRRERFHEAGSAAVNGDITPYLIGVVWQALRGAKQPNRELMIRGTSRLLLKPNPSVEDFLVLRCVGWREFDELISKVIHYSEQ